MRHAKKLSTSNVQRGATMRLFSGHLPKLSRLQSGKRKMKSPLSERDVVERLRWSRKEASRTCKDFKRFTAKIWPDLSKSITLIRLRSRASPRVSLKFFSRTE